MEQIQPKPYSEDSAAEASPETVITEEQLAAAYDKFKLFQIGENFEAYVASGVDELELYRMDSTSEDLLPHREAARRSIRVLCDVTGYVHMPAENGENVRHALGMFEEPVPDGYDGPAKESLFFQELYVEDDETSGGRVLTYVFKAKKVMSDHERAVVEFMWHAKGDKRFEEFSNDPLLHRIRTNGSNR